MSESSKKVNLNDLSINHVDSVEKLNNFIQNNGVKVTKTTLKKYNYRECLAYFNRIRLDAYENESGYIDWENLGLSFDLELHLELLGYDESSLENGDECDYESYFYEKLEMWPTYFDPFCYDEKIAVECGLLAFKIHGITLLALGGCGMDLSPRLDAYQALTSGTIDSYSTFFAQKDYFVYVVGEDIAQRVEDAITLKNPIVEISLSEVA